MGGQRGTSKYKGVSWSERSHKWRAQLWFETKVGLGFRVLGSFLLPPLPPAPAPHVAPL